MMVVYFLVLLAFDSVSVWTAENPANNYLSEMLRMRDPFRKPESTAAMKIFKSQLEKYSISEFRMIGVLTGPNKMRALVSAPDGKNYFVAEGMKMGLRGGFVKKITSDQIQVREKIVNIIGEEENVDSEIRLVAESNFQLERKLRESAEQRGEGTERGQNVKSDEQQSGGGTNTFMNVMKDAIKAAVGGGGSNPTPQNAQPTAPAPVPQSPPAAPDWAKPQVLGIKHGNEFKPSLGGSK